MTHTEFDKYYYYHASVQSTEFEAEFLIKTFLEVRGYLPKSFREDFCGTHALACEIAKTKELRSILPQLKVYGVDIDPEPLGYGQEHYYSKLTPEQKEAVIIKEGNVLSSELPRVQMAFAFNFSYFIFKERAALKQYFQNLYDSTEDDGVIMLDCFGGGNCHEPNEEETEYEDEGFSYFWDQDTFNPINNHAQFYIHFQRTGEKKQEKVFSYDWRMWSIPEIRELLAEVGFKETHVYWEGTDEEGEGNGVYTRTEEGDECESWVSYIIGVK